MFLLSLLFPQLAPSGLLETGLEIMQMVLRGTEMDLAAINGVSVVCLL